MTRTLFADRTIDCREAGTPVGRLGHALTELPPGRTIEVLAGDANQVAEVRAWCNQHHHPLVDLWSQNGTFHIYVRP